MNQVCGYSHNSHVYPFENEPESPQRKSYKEALLEMEILQVRRLEIYRDCHSIFGKYEIVKAAESIYSSIQTWMGYGSSHPNPKTQRKNLRDKLASLHIKAAELRSLFLQFPLREARQNILIHSDHLQGIPLYGALLQGIANIETDVRYHQGKLMIAHEKDELELGLHFEELYLKPLLELVQERPQLFSNNMPFSIFIDLKLSQTSESNMESRMFYQELHTLIQKYSEMLEHYDGDGTLQRGAVRLVITGDDRRVGYFARQRLQKTYLFLDGRFNDDEVPKKFVVMRSVRYPLLGNWKSTYSQHKASTSGDLPLRFWSVPGDKYSSLQEITRELWTDFKNYNIIYNTDYPIRLISFLDSASG